MTLGDVYRQGKGFLTQAQNQSPAFEASALFQKAFGLDRQERIIRSAEVADPAKSEEYFSMLRERAAGRPLQYILGEWQFFGINMKVGEGVLIPREETELLVNAAAGLLKGNPAPRVIDLCAGSGAVALGLASLMPDACITAAELYGEAFGYLRENICKTGFSNVTPVKLNILDPSSAKDFDSVDCIVSNPPYVKTGEIAGLQTEVRKEPQNALDGGGDGLRFYRAIAEIWLPKLKPGGAAAVEIGEGQAADVCGIFRNANFNKAQIYKDFNGIERVVGVIGG